RPRKTLGFLSPPPKADIRFKGSTGRIDKDMPLSLVLKWSFRGGGTGNKLHLMSVQLRCAAVPSSGSKSNIERWGRAFAALCKFRAREAHCCPRRDHIEGGFKLDQWVCVQRYLKDDVLPERKRRLDAIGFVWDWRDNLWEQNF